MKSLGLISCNLSEAERDVGPPYHFPDALLKLGAGEVNRPLPWSELTDAQREQIRPLAERHRAETRSLVERQQEEILALLTPEQQWRLAAAWYTNRLAPDWRRRSAEEAEALFAELDLEGEFWRLRP